MRVCVFGAGGRTGVEVVRCVVERGWAATAFLHNTGAQQMLPDEVRVERGDVMDCKAVRRAVQGADAVISALGHGRGTAPTMHSDGMRNIARAMEDEGVQRIISLTGTGVRIDGDMPSLADAALNGMAWMVAPGRMRDAVDHLEVLRASRLAWTVVRVLLLTSSAKPPAPSSLTDHGPAQLFTSRKQAAQTMTDLIQDKRHICKAPIISSVSTAPIPSVSTYGQ